jgi:hypothetical protein
MAERITARSEGLQERIPQSSQNCRILPVPSDVDLICLFIFSYGVLDTLYCNEHVIRVQREKYRS